MKKTSQTTPFLRYQSNLLSSVCVPMSNTQTHYPVVKRRGTRFIIQMSVQPAIYWYTSTTTKGGKYSILTVHVRMVRGRRLANAD